MGERVLFLTSNGTGLGHLTRVMAIARRLSDPEAASILTLSAAAPVAAREGFHVEYLPSHSAAAAEAPRRWDRRLQRRLENLVAELAPTVLVFDGPHPYDGLIAFLRGATRDGLRTVWLRRPMWRPGVGAEGIYWSGEFDLIVEPGELAASADCGLTADRRDEVTTVPPIVYLDPGELVPREQAERELGLEPGRVNALVALGQGESLDEAVARSLATLAADPGIQVAALESGLSPKLQIPDGVVLLEATYPVARYHHAFDLAVAAAGYNAFHELIANGVPSLFVPMPRKLDDQPARAMWAREAGVGEGVGGPQDTGLEERLGRLLDAGVRDEIRARIAELDFENGASRAAGILGELLRAPVGVAGARVVDAAASGAGRMDRLAVSAQLLRRVGARLPAIVARRAVDRVRNPPPAAAKVVVPALGLEGGELVESLQAVARREGTEPDRVLAITDSLDFAALRRAGFAFEYVPSEERAAPVLALTGESYKKFAQRRIKEATALRASARFASP